jgi:hypothetical protein
MCATAAHGRFQCGPPRPGEASSAARWPRRSFPKEKQPDFSPVPREKSGISGEKFGFVINHWDNLAERRAWPATHWQQSAQHIGPTRRATVRSAGSFVPLTRTEPAGRQQAPTAAQPGRTRHCRQNVPGDDPPQGPGATSECQNSCTAGPPARADQVLQHNATVTGQADPTATS